MPDRIWCLLNTKFTRFVLRLIISLGIIAIFAYYLYENADKYLELLHISRTGVLILFLLSLTFPLLNGMQNTYLYRGLGVAEFSHWDSFLITAASTLANQLPIPGGILSRGYYLKQRYNLSYSKYTSSTVATLFLYLAVNGLIGVLVLFYWIVINRLAIPSVLLIGFTAMMACILVFWLPFERISMTQRIRHWAHQILEGWTAIGQNPVLLFRLGVLQATLVAMLSLRYWIAFHMLSQDISLGQTLLFASASILTQLVSIAPGGLGVREAIVASVATVLGFDTGVSIVAVSLDRLVVTVMIVLTGWVSTLILGKQISDTPKEAA
jgi:uncharacterized membrane protein YbhN (UPF0104 family)